jgi:beta-glucosidase
MVEVMIVMKVLCWCLLVQSVVGLLPWMNVKDTPEERAKKLLAQMNLDEKLSLLHGYGGDYVGNVPSITVSKTGGKIPALHLEDGPSGVADGVTQVTCWPSALTVVATWNRESMKAYGTALAEEQFGKGTNVMLGPMVNLGRVPFGGRNFESFGEDPVLAARMTESNILGVQSQPMIATVKHFVDNNQEDNRTVTSANVDERTQYEMYYPAFEAAIKVGVGAVMCSYNRINDTYACENDQTLNKDLKQKLGFKGWVMSDWGATHSTVKAANAGLDQQMPDASFFGDELKKAVQQGQVTQARIDDMTLRILIPMFAAQLFDVVNNGNLSVNVQTAAHTMLARDLATEATVLLQNVNQILPIKTKNVKIIAVLGDAGDKSPIVAGGGSGHVIPPYIISPLKGIQNRVSGLGITVNYAPTSPLNVAVDTAKNADIAIVCVGTSSSEGWDRPSLALGKGQDELIAAIAQVQSNTVVVLNIPGPTLMPWASSVAGILTGFMPGQECGNALAAILFGDANPSARLPFTFPVSEKLIPVNTPEQYPGINNEAQYSEKLLVGYRWYDAKQQPLLFPFGHGLSYTTFSYSNLQIDSTNYKISFTITNTGTVAGDEVAQLYIGYPPSAGEPPKNLRRFSKLHYESNQSHDISYFLNDRDFSIWDITTHQWKVISGSYTVFIGSSSRDIRLTGTLLHK